MDINVSSAPARAVMVSSPLARHLEIKMIIFRDFWVRERIKRDGNPENEPALRTVLNETPF